MLDKKREEAIRDWLIKTMMDETVPGTWWAIHDLLKEVDRLRERVKELENEPRYYKDW